MAVHSISDNAVEQARRFLLGRLAADEAERFETRILADEGLFETVQAVEEEFLHDFVRNAVSAEERPILAARFERQPDRLRFAAALAQRARHRTTSRRLIWGSAAAAAAIVLVIGGLSWRLRSSSPPLVMHTQGAVPTSTGSLHEKTGKVVAMTIALVTTRDGEQPEGLTLAADVTAVALTVRLNPADRYSAYNVVLRRASGASLWKGRVTNPTSNEITVTVPASALRQGELQVSVAGLGAGGKREELGEQTIAVHLESP